PSATGVRDVMVTPTTSATAGVTVATQRVMTSAASARTGCFICSSPQAKDHRLEQFAEALDINRFPFSNSHGLGTLICLVGLRISTRCAGSPTAGTWSNAA